MYHKKGFDVFNKFTVALMLLVLSLIVSQKQIFAQQEDTAKLKSDAIKMLNGNNIVGAIPLLEKALAALPNDGELNFYMGFALVGRTKISRTDDEKIKDLTEAKQYFVKAKQLGYKNALLDQFLDAYEDGGNGPGGAKFSSNKEADAEMQTAESFFTQGKLTEAIVHYKKAFELDPKIYEAPLFIGDSYFKSDDFGQAEIWFQKAIAVDPNRETAYRYSASPLMQQKKFVEARDRYIEAFISEPYNSLAVNGFLEWGKVTNTVLANPDIKIPAGVSKGANGNTTITLGGGDGKDDGSFAWTAYGISRALWQPDKDGKLSDKFKQAYPSETVYRHSLAEEAESLKSVVAIIKEQNSKIKSLDPSLKTLVEISDKGLLEAYILVARIDRGIAHDYVAYRNNHRDNLRRYVLEYIVKTNA